MKKLFIYFMMAGLVFWFASCDDDNTELPDTVSSLSPKAYSSDMARDWFKLECTVVKETPGFFPPQAARAFGYSGLTLYETVVQGWDGAEDLAGQVNGLEISDLPKAETDQFEYNWALAANAALADMMRKMFGENITAENAARVDDLEADWQQELSLNVDQAVVDRSLAFGKAMSEAVYEYSKSDGGHESYIDPFQLPYTWPAINGAWIPTGAVPNPLSPNWGSNRPFLNSNIQQGQPVAHTPYETGNNSEFYNEAMNVYDVVTNADAEKVEIAKFWADDPFNTCTPTGHTFNIMTQLLEENDANLAMAAVGYAKLGIAENDAFICCWKTKYDYFLIRPVTYIRQNIDPNFNTLIGTPPFPAYTSGHATEAAAGSRIFTNMFTDGDGYYVFTDRTQIQFGFSVRNFNNFDEMANECANSRLYGGIHYNTDNLNGLKMGKSVGDNVNHQINWPKDF